MSYLPFVWGGGGCVFGLNHFLAKELMVGKE
ncbi:hypothetical protein IJGDABAG_00135 [Ostreid herpesvirus 1]|nr:hypothetical protein KIOFAAIH_00004 [Ostreid herpesvirus 1]UPX72937.1 hypothetical protein KIOFAAIH_00130 [Ostreid herpesvirus 1]UPX74777.1 hypothetical protein IJGDABAG_00005 [Ostreid herpesvirus 1]UPX74907.1 hypothetical protein IJGDABAG_00135 [Ostreid herpesvirus 1]